MITVKSLFSALLRIRRWKKAVWNCSTDFPYSFSTKVKWARKGFSINEYIWYGLEHNDYRDYISEFERLESRDINGDFKFILDNKLVFEEVYGKYARVPKNYAMISDGEVYSLHGSRVDNDRFAEFLRSAGRTILKWTDRGGGAGTYLLEEKDGALLINGEEATPEKIEKLRKRKGEAMLCEYVEQSAFAASLYPHTTNTMRIVCARKKGEREYKIVAAVQRIGCKASIPVDNISYGGMTCGIDLETGELSHAIAKLGVMERRMKPFTSHPDTGEQIAGKVIPGWSQLKEEIITLTEKTPYLNFVAWDVLLTEEGFCIIEGNASSGCGMFQMERGIRNDLLGDIYRSYGVIS